MKWRASISKNKRIRATLMSFVVRHDPVIVLICAPILAWLAGQVKSDLIQTLLIVDIILLITLPFFLVARALALRKKMIVMAGTDIVVYELTAKVLRFTLGRDKMEFPRDEIAVQKLGRDVVICKRTSLRTGNQFVLYFDSPVELNKVVLEIRKGVKK